MLFPAWPKTNILFITGYIYIYKVCDIIKYCFVLISFYLIKQLIFYQCTQCNVYTTFAKIVNITIIMCNYYDFISYSLSVTVIFFHVATFEAILDRYNCIKVKSIVCSTNRVRTSWYIYVDISTCLHACVYARFNEPTID